MVRRQAVSRDISVADQALQGQEFVEDAIQWKVLEVEWSGKDRRAVVWYYDVVMAAQQGITEESMEAASVQKRNSIEPLERSTVAEIREWITDSRKRLIVTSV